MIFIYFFKYKLLKFLSILLLLFGVVSVNASNLPPEHEAARLLLLLESLVAESRWQEAEQQLSDIEKLGTELPIVFNYYAGRIYLEQQVPRKAARYLENYVVQAGSDGEFYKEALQMITRVDALVEQGDVVRSPLPSLKPETDSYLNSIKALFLTEDAVSALQQHINSLLAAHIYTGSRVKLEGERVGVKFSISVAGDELVVKRASYDSGQPTLSVDKVPIFGVDPFLNYRCSDSEYLCWISHPSKRSERWLWIDRDELVATELVKALGKLLQVLQSNNS